MVELLLLGWIGLSAHKLAKRSRPRIRLIYYEDIPLPVYMGTELDISLKEAYSSTDSIPFHFTLK